jgi:acyl carrier protein
MNSEKTMHSSEEIISHIQKWLIDKYRLTIDINDRYIDSGLVDSLDMINLIVFIESSYNVKFSSDDFQDPRFFTVKGLSELVMVRISNA